VVSDFQVPSLLGKAHHFSFPFSHSFGADVVLYDSDEKCFANNGALDEVMLQGQRANSHFSINKK
jgi:hypothetical protein